MLNLYVVVVVYRTIYTDWNTHLQMHGQEIKLGARHCVPGCFNDLDHVSNTISPQDPTVSPMFANPVHLCAHVSSKLTK